jgi:hypothetical protein
MTVDDALNALAKSPSTDYAVIVLRNDRGDPTAAPVLGVALDDTNEDVSLLIGEFSEEETALEDAILVDEVRDALREAGPACASWGLYSAEASGDAMDGDLGGSLVGFSLSDDIEVFAFLQGPKSDWDDD